MHYGNGGWNTYNSEDDMKSEVLPWVAKTIIEITKGLSDLARIQEIILGVTTNK